jgi:hypothetical protein
LRDLNTLLEDRLDVVEIQHRGGVAFGVFRIGMAFEEEAIDAGGDGGAGQQGGILRIAAALGALAGGLLRAVGDVENHGIAEVFHDRQAGEIVDQAVVAEECAALGQQDLVVSCGFDFFDGIFHFGRRHELAFFHVDPPAGRATGEEQIGLAGQKCGDLKDIDDFRGGGGLRGFVNVREHGHAGFALYFFEDFQTFIEAWPAESVFAGAIGFVEAGFENVSEAELVANLFDPGGDEQAKRFGFDHAWAADHEKWRPVAMEDVGGMSHTGTINGTCTGSKLIRAGV